MELELYYQQIQNKFEELSDFSVESLTRSRNLFHLEARIVPREFDVWTVLVGLPLPEQLTQNFQILINQIVAELPATKRFYTVLPENYHWELFIIQRPDEAVDNDYLQKTSEILRKVLSSHPPFTISYRGFLITTDGTIIAKGYGNFAPLRSQLRQHLPWASLQQSNLGHVSLGRLLDPVGDEYFSELKQLIVAHQHESYGELNVSAAKYVHERQWYMEARKIIAVLPFGNSDI